MNAQSDFILMPIDVTSQAARRVVLVLLIVMGLTVYHLAAPVWRVAAVERDLTVELYELVMDAQGDVALQVVMTKAQALGGWEPAPRDVVVYDPDLADSIGGAVRFIDSGPVGCVNPKIARLLEDCLIDYSLKENWVRLGRAMFVAGIADGSPAPQPVFDDLLATYIEEVGHSWQEFLTAC